MSCIVLFLLYIQKETEQSLCNFFMNSLVDYARENFWVQSYLFWKILNHKLMFLRDMEYSDYLFPFKWVYFFNLRLSRIWAFYINFKFMVVLLFIISSYFSFNFCDVYIDIPSFILHNDNLSSFILYLSRQKFINWINLFKEQVFGCIDLIDFSYCFVNFNFLSVSAVIYYSLPFASLLFTLLAFF